MVIKSDFLIIGSGIAGLSLAIKTAQLGSVALVTKKRVAESNTNYAQGGIAAVQAEDDSFESHIQDTLVCGDGLCQEDVVRFTVKEGPARVAELIEWGVAFTKSWEKGGADALTATTGYDLGKEGGHSQRRVLHASDFTGQEIERALSEKIKANPNITVYENHIAIDLITTPSPSAACPPDRTKRRCLGAYVLDVEREQVHTFRARFSALATGGAGKVYLVTTNPDIATGDGIAMAYRAGARIANMEFFQFHPTCLYHGEAKSFLISEALRGEGGILKLRNGNTFMERYHHSGGLAPRDVVARAIDAELKKSGDDYVLLDMTHKGKDFLVKRFPNIYVKCLGFGIDMAKIPIPVAPAAHYLCGGVLVDEHGRTDICNLYACGEVACTGLHGANRLASNSLLEAVVFAHRAFTRIKADFALTGKQEKDGDAEAIPEWDASHVTASEEKVVVSHNWDELRRCMSSYVGIVRTNRRLARARQRVRIIADEVDEFYHRYQITQDLLELRNITTIAGLIVDCALARKESRGLHYNLDYPSKSQQGARDTIIEKEQG